jgi:ankyrin repeat protein
MENRLIISQKLFHAVEKGDLDTIRSELARGVDVDVKDKFGEPTLHRAAQYNFRALEILLKHGGKC